MAWTSEPPKQPGYYWAKIADYLPTGVVRVDKDDRVWYHGCEVEDYLPWVKDVLWWDEPIEVPPSPDF